LPSCQLHISVNRTAQIYLELHFCVELHTKKSPVGEGAPKLHRHAKFHRCSFKMWPYGPKNRQKW